MHCVGRIADLKFKVPPCYEGHSKGYERMTLIEASVGSVHMGLGICRIQPEGFVAQCVHANEKGIYVLEGEVQLSRGNESSRLSTDDYALVPYGTVHAYRGSGTSAARWLEMQAPQPKPEGDWQDTFFTGATYWPEAVAAPDMNDPRMRLWGHFSGGMPVSPGRGGARGLSVNVFMNREFGAQNFAMMRGQIATGGSVGLHDHPIEESYLFLSGTVEMEIEGRRYTLGPGDFAWTGVGASHAFFQRGKAPVQWIETQAPQFPAQNGFRFYAAWDKLREIQRF